MTRFLARAGGLLCPIVKKGHDNKYNATMSMDSLNGPRRPASASPVSHPPKQGATEADNESVHQNRKVSVHSDTGRMVPSLKNTHEQHFLPLTHRDKITQPARRVKPGKMIDFFSSLAMPVVTRGLNEKPRKTLQELKRKKKALKAGYQDDADSLKKVNRQLAKTQKKLTALRTKYKTLKPKEYQSLVRALDDQGNLLTLKSELESAQAHYGTEIDLIKQIETKLRHQRDKTESFLKAAVKSGARLLSGLQQIYTAKADPANQEAVYQIDLGDVTLTDAGYYDVKLEALQARIDRCSMEGDNFVINVAECSARCQSRSGDSAFEEPVELAGAFSFTIKPPLAAEILDIMKSAPHKVPGKIQKVWAEFKANELNPDTSEPRSKWLDFIDIHIDGVSQKQETGGCFDLLNQAGGQILLKLLSPVISSTKRHTDDAALSDLQYNIIHHHKEVQRHQQSGQLLGTFATELQQDIQALEAAGQRSDELQALKQRVSSQIDTAAKEEATYHKAESEEESRLAVAQSVARGRDGWLEGFDNMVDVLFSLRGAMLNASEENPSMIDVKPQKIRVGESGYVEVDNLQVQVSDIEMTHGGVLTITVPRASAKMTVGNELQNPQSEDMILSGLKLTLNPPLGKLAWELLNLKFPISASHFNELRRQYNVLTSEAPLVGAGPALPALKDLISFQLEKVESASGVKIPADEEANAAGLADKVSVLAGTEVNEKELQSFLGRFVTMSDGSQREVKSLLSMALLGLGHAAGPSPRNEESIRRLASKIAASNKQGFDEWEVVKDEQEFEATDHLDKPPVTNEAKTEDALDDDDENELFEDARSEFSDQDSVDAPSQAQPMVTEPEQSEEEKVEALIQKKSRLIEDSAVQERAFEVSTDLRSLMGQLKGFFSFFLGKSSDVLTVTNRVGERGVSTVRLKKGNFLRRIVVNWMLKKSLKRRAGTIVALSDDHQSLVLKLREPDRSMRILPGSPQDDS
ncbi:hypothetical protein [Endozoicomonas montiporae]|nr:hypothetical protein [Endozoicomonas montiporae]